MVTNQWRQFSDEPKKKKGRGRPRKEGSVTSDEELPPARRTPVEEPVQEPVQEPVVYEHITQQPEVEKTVVDEPVI